MRIRSIDRSIVTRVRNKLEKEGYILEYTMMPNFINLGYHLFALTFVSMKQTISPEEAEKARTTAVGAAKGAPANIVVIEKGMGLGHTAVIGSFHKDYASYVELADKLKRDPYLESKSDSFLINLDDKIHYRHLTLATLAKDLLTLKEMDEKARIARDTEWQISMPSVQGLWVREDFSAADLGLDSG